MMKPHLTAIALLTASIAPASAQQAPGAPLDPSERIRYTLIFPEEKTPELVKPNENNPFTKTDGKKIDQDQTNSEENTVRDFLQQHRVSGVGRNYDGTLSCMLGPWRLVSGSIIPKVFEGQSVQLRVNSISPHSLDLVWVEAKKGVPPRVLSLPIDVLDPKVRYILATPKKAETTPDEKAPSFLFQDAANGALPKAPTEARRAIPVEDDEPAVATQPTDSTTPPASTPATAEPSSLGKALLNLLNQSPTPQPTATPSAKPATK